MFETTHRLVLGLVAEGLVDGVRIDHPDGLADPRGYLERLASEGVERIWVEKILEPGEQLRDWPVEGTTGYEFLNDTQSLFIDPAGEEVLTELARERRTFGEIAHEAKFEQASHDLPAGGRAPAPPARPAGPSGGAGVASGLPHLRRARDGQGRGRRPRGPGRACPTTSAACCCSRSAATTSS